MSGADVLADAFDRVQPVVHAAVEDLTAEQLAERLEGHGNSIAWLIWHLTRVQDDHIAEVAESEQVWTAAGFYEHFGLPFDESEIGYGMTSQQVSQVKVDSPALLVEYYDAVHAQTLNYVRGLADDDLPRVIDDSWAPPVTLGVRLVSVISDCLQHVGQASYVRGIVTNR